jgi:hypothetical protein
MGPLCQLDLDGEPIEMAFGERITVGRADATVSLGAPGISRRHLEIYRGSEGPMIRDLGSRNGTRVAGARLDTPIAVGAGLEVQLGSEVTLGIAPATIGEQWLRVEVAARAIVAPLGVARIGALTVSDGADGWLEADASSGSLVLGKLLVRSPIQLCHGDEVRESRDGPVRLRVP